MSLNVAVEQALLVKVLHLLLMNCRVVPVELPRVAAIAYSLFQIGWPAGMREVMVHLLLALLNQQKLSEAQPAASLNVLHCPTKACFRAQPPA